MILNRQIVCDQSDITGDHHGYKDQIEKDIFAFEIIEYKGKGCQGADDDLTYDHDGTVDQGVDRIGVMMRSPINIRKTTAKTEEAFRL